MKKIYLLLLSLVFITGAAALFAGGKREFRIDQADAPGGEGVVYYPESPDPESRPQCTIKTFGAVNEFITGTLAGNYKDSFGVYYPLTCDFKVKRFR